MFFRATDTLVTGDVTPATVMVEGYVLAGAPVVAPVPVAGITIAVLFENVVDAVVVVPNGKL